MRKLAALAILMVPALAHADAPRIEALTDAETADTVDAAIELAIRGDDTCHPKCTFAIDKTLALPNGMRATVRHATNTTFDATGYIVAFTANDRAYVWSTADQGQFRNPAVTVIAESSGMGKSLNEKLESITMARSATMLWVRVVVESSITHWNNDEVARKPSTATSHLQYLIGCRYTTETPACAAFGPASRYDDNHISVTGPDTLSVDGQAVRLR